MSANMDLESFHQQLFAEYRASVRCFLVFQNIVNKISLHSFMPIKFLSVTVKVQILLVLENLSLFVALFGPYLARQIALNKRPSKFISANMLDNSKTGGNEPQCLFSLYKIYCIIVLSLKMLKMSILTQNCVKSVNFDT